MIKAQLQLGSNATSRRQNLERAVEILAKDFRILKISAVVESQDVTGGPTVFVNQLLEIETDFTADELHLHCKQIEASFGHRTPIVTHMEVVRSCTQIIPLDIDLVIYDSKILKPADINRPYYRTILAQGF